jgi:two-component system response regulator RegX3
MRTLERASVDAAEDARVVPLRIAEAQIPATIVLVEVEALLADSIKYTLERDGYRILAPATRGEALATVQAEQPRLVMVEAPAGPLRASLDFCRRARGSIGSILLITPAISERDRATAIEAGVSEVLIKPFSLRDLADRVGRQLRRDRVAVANHDSDDEVLRVGPVEMDVTHHEVRVRGKLVVFPPKEFALLETLLRSRGRLLTRARLIVAVWGADYYGDGKTLDTHVKRLREKIEEDRRQPSHLIVVRGLGYRFVDRELAAD